MTCSDQKGNLMSSFLKSVIKRIDNRNATIADSGIYSDVTGFINTGTLLLNALFSGSMFKGIPDNKITMVAGPEGVGKSFMLLSIISSFFGVSRRECSYL